VGFHDLRNGLAFDGGGRPRHGMRAQQTLMLLVLSLSLLGCQERPLTQQEIQDQHRFEVGCRFQDAQGYEQALPYCGHHGGGR